MSHSKKRRGAALVVGAVFTGAALLVAWGLSSPDVAPERPAPRGLINDGPATVMVYNGAWHGAPPEAPFATVDGAFELTGFPYEQAGSYASVFFVKESCAVQHASVRAPGEDQAAAPEMGIVQMQTLDAGMGGVTGALVKLDVQGRFVESYPDAEVSFHGPDGAKHAVRSGGPDGFQLALAPGRYEVRVNGEQATTSEVTVTAGTGAPLILLAPGPLTSPR